MSHLRTVTLLIGVVLLSTRGLVACTHDFDKFEDASGNSPSDAGQDGSADGAPCPQAETCVTTQTSCNADCDRTRDTCNARCDGRSRCQKECSDEAERCAAKCQATCRSCASACAQACR